MNKKLKLKLRSGVTLTRDRKGGLTMFELIIGMLIITIASVAVASSFYTAHGELARQRRRQMANQLLKAEAEFWKGRVHSAMPSPYEMEHNIPNPKNPIPLDTYTAGNRQVSCEVWKSPIREVNIPETKIDPDYYEFTVWVTYEEPNLDRVVFRTRNNHPKKVTYELVVPFFPAAI